MLRIALAIVTGWVLVMGNPAYASSVLAGTKWRIESVKDAGAVNPAEARFAVDAEGRIATTVGCNQFSGRADIAGSSLSIGPLASTRMACAPDLMDLEQKYGAALAATRSFQIEGPILRLMDGAGVEVVRLSRAP